MNLLHSGGKMTFKELRAIEEAYHNTTAYIHGWDIGWGHGVNSKPKNTYDDPDPVWLEGYEAGYEAGVERHKNPKSVHPVRAYIMGYLGKGMGYATTGNSVWRKSYSQGEKDAEGDKKIADSVTEWLDKYG